MRFSNAMKSSLVKILYGSAFSILLVTFLQMVFIGKNLTFTTRFTPFESDQNSLKNQTYITQAQALIIFICILYVFVLPTTTYSCINHKRKAFFPILMVTIGLNGLLVFLNMYFLTGASAYRNYMNDKYHDMINNGYCQSSKTTLCIVGTCARMQMFEQAKRMSIAFTVIDCVLSLVFTVISILINKQRKQAQKMQLIV